MKNTTTQVRDRKTVLAKRRNLKMARSAHAYVRGNTVKFCEWLTSVSANQLPRGPSIWICGDCHVGNLGPLASADGRVEIGIRELDQTVIGNPAHDLVRLGLSLATAARGSDLPGVTTAHMLEAMIDGYERATSHPKKSSSKGYDASQSINAVLERALKRKWRHLAEERIEDLEPAIPLGKSFWPLSRTEKREIARVFKTEEAGTLVTSLHHLAATITYTTYEASRPISSTGHAGPHTGDCSVGPATCPHAPTSRPPGGSRPVLQHLVHGRPPHR